MIPESGRKSCTIFDEQILIKGFNSFLEKTVQFSAHQQSHSYHNLINKSLYELAHYFFNRNLLKSIPTSFSEKTLHNYCLIITYTISLWSVVWLSNHKHLKKSIVTRPKEDRNYCHISEVSYSIISLYEFKSYHFFIRNFAKRDLILCLKKIIIR